MLLSFIFVVFVYICGVSQTQKVEGGAEGVRTREKKRRISGSSALEVARKEKGAEATAIRKRFTILFVLQDTRMSLS